MSSGKKRTLRFEFIIQWSISNVKELARKLADAVKTYNRQRPHQSLNGMSPVEYEKHLEAIENKKREKVTIYTVIQ